MFHEKEVSCLVLDVICLLNLTRNILLSIPESELDEPNSENSASNQFVDWEFRDQENLHCAPFLFKKYINKKLQNIQAGNRSKMQRQEELHICRNEFI